MRILGIDPSVTSCGIVVIDENRKVLLGEVIGYTIDHASEIEKIKRSLEISKKIIEVGKRMDCSFVAVEGLGISAKGGRIGNQLILAELLGIIKSQIVLSLNKVPIIVPPSTWKKMIIGSGNAKKDQIKGKLTESGYVLGKQDIYDALGVALFVRTKYCQAIEGKINGKGTERSNTVR